MVPVNYTDPKVISEAIIVWTGWGTHPIPVRDESLLVERFGEQAVDLLPVIKALEDDFYASDARHTAADTREMGEVASAQFRKLHPELTGDATRALAWCYTFDYK